MTFMFPSCDILSVDPIMAMSIFNKTYIQPDRAIIQQIKQHIEKTFNGHVIKAVIRYMIAKENKKESDTIGYYDLLSSFTLYCDTINTFFKQVTRKGSSSDVINSVHTYITAILNYKKFNNNDVLFDNFGARYYDSEYKDIAKYNATIPSNVRYNLESIHSPTLSILSLSDILPADFDDIDPWSDTSSVLDDDHTSVLDDDILNLANGYNNNDDLLSSDDNTPVKSKQTSKLREPPCKKVDWDPFEDY